MSTKLYTAALALILTAMPVSGQQLELKAGMNLSTLSGDAVVGATREMGMNFGLGIGIPIVPGFGLTIGTNFSKKGVEQTAGGVTSVMDLSYIEIPVLFRVGLLSAGTTSLDVVLGPNLGISTGCDLTTDALGTPTTTDCGTDLKKTDIGGVVGLGISFAVGNSVSLGLDTTYNMGLTSLSNGAGPSAFDGLKNSTLTMQSRVSFSIF